MTHWRANHRRDMCPCPNARFDGDQVACSAAISDPECVGCPRQPEPRHSQDGDLRWLGWIIVVSSALAGPIIAFVIWGPKVCG